MAKLSPVKARRLVSVLYKLGFEQTHRRGSHFFFAHSDGRTTVVPIHPTKEIGVGLLRSILHDIKLSPEEFGNLR